jgi:hypothetical protein
MKHVSYQLSATLAKQAGFMPTPVQAIEIHNDRASEGFDLGSKEGSGYA